MKYDYALYTVDDYKRTDINIEECGWEKCHPKHSYGHYARKSYLLHFLVDGEGTYITENRKYQLRAGDLFLISPNTENFYYANPKNPYEYYWVVFTGAESKRLLNLIDISLENPVAHFESINTIKQMFISLINAARKYNEIYNLELLGHFYRLMSYLATFNQKIVNPNKQSPYIQQAVQYIHQHFMNPITVTDIAKHVNLHRGYLNELFKKEFNLSPKQYLITHRMKMACKLMRATTMTIQEISTMVGFPDQMNFSTRFKKYIGVPPGEYRKQNFDKDRNEEFEQAQEKM